MLNIKESALFIGVSEKSIYKYVKTGKLPATTDREYGKSVKRFKQEDLEKFKREHFSHRLETSFTGNSQERNGKNVDIKELLKEVIQEQQLAILKPMEEQALYVAGALTKENQFLKEQNETLRMEIEQLRENLKALPGPEEINTKIHQFEQQVTELQQEKEKTTAALQEEKTTRFKIEEDLSQLQKEKQHIVETTYRLEEEKKKLEEQLKLFPAEPEKINATLLQNAEHLLMLKLQNEEIEKKYLEMESILKSEEEKKQELNSRLKVEEQEKVALVDQLKSEEEKRKAEEQSKKELEEKLLAEQEYKKKQEEEKQHLETELKKIQEQAEEWKKKALKPWWKFWK
jgi:chromosome segregation ATPase